MAFDAIALAAAYRVRASERVVVTPWLRAHYQQPWHTRDEADGSPDYFQTTGTRGTAGVAVSTEVSPRVQVHAGAEGYVEYSEVGAGAPDVQLFPGGATEITHESASAYVEADLRTEWVDVTAGGRAEAHSDYGATAVPRIAATTSIDRAHAKLLVAQGYRAPSIQNLRIEPEIEPERMTNLELEAGYRFGDHVSAIIDVFDGTLKNPIVYGFDGQGMNETYANYTQTGSRGVELDLRTRGDRGFATLAYSFFTAAGKNVVDRSAVPGSRARLLAAPRHKLTLHGAIAAGPRVVIGGAVVVLGPRHAVVGVDAGMRPTYGVIDTDVVLNATVHVRDVGVAGLDVSLGLHDALDARPLMLQPYASGHAPYPGPGREVLLRVSYERP
jgi:outer membrane receptor protein involved in Fe transport